MKAFFELVVQWVRPLLAGLNIRLVVKAVKLAYDLMIEIERQSTEGDGKFTNAEKAEWVKKQLKELTTLPDSIIDFIFGVAIARFVKEKREAAAKSLPATEAN